MIDYSEDAPVVSEASLSKVSRKALELQTAQQQKEEMEADLNRLSEQIRRIETFELPEAMAEAMMTRFDLTNGSILTVKDVISGSVPKSVYEEALQWLRDHGHDGIIKRCISVTVYLPKGQDKIGNMLIKYLRKLKTLQTLGVVPKDEPTVHAQTYGAWARELYKAHEEEHLAEGTVEKNCPFCNEEVRKTLGLYVGKKAEIKKAKG